MDDLKRKYLDLIAGAADEASIEEVRLAALGKKGELSLKMRELGQMSPEERQVAGPALNALKDEITSALAAKKAALGDAALNERLRAEWLDVTLPGRGRRAGNQMLARRRGRARLRPGRGGMQSEVGAEAIAGHTRGEACGAEGGNRLRQPASGPRRRRTRPQA